MVDAASGLVVGVAVAGIPKDGDLDHNVGLFVPVVGVASFMEANGQKALAPAPAGKQFIEPAPGPSQPSGTTAKTSPVALKASALTSIGTSAPKTPSDSE